MTAGRLLLLCAALASGCSVDVGSLAVAVPPGPPPPAVAYSRGWHEGTSCRAWVAGVPLGLPRIEEAMADALRPVGGAFMRNATIWSVHPVYGLFGWHCYRVRGEVFARDP